MAHAQVQSRVPSNDVRKFITQLVGEHIHAKRVLSISNAVVGVIHAAALSIHAIGHALAEVDDLDSKHAIKQVDRLLSNGGFDVWKLFEYWVPFVIGGRDELVVAMDWTDFERDDQTTIAISLMTGHGRATPLLWKTVRKSTIKGQRAKLEDQLLERLRELVPLDTRVTVLADRGFGDKELYFNIDQLGFKHVIRFRQIITVESAKGEIKPAADWVPANGRPALLRNARVTHERSPVAAVVCVRAADMKDAWCLASNIEDKPASELVKLYGRRFTIEETFRDAKNLRFGLGLSNARIKDPARRDRMLMLSAFAQALLTLLGAAAEEVGLDRTMKASTTKKRTHSLFRQGLHWYNSIPAMRQERLDLLMGAFGRIVSQHAVFTKAFGTI
jgi:hypothetical protein